MIIGIVIFIFLTWVFGIVLAGFNMMVANKEPQDMKVITLIPIVGALFHIYLFVKFLYRYIELTKYDE